MQLHRFPFKAMGSPCQLQLYAVEKSHAQLAAEAAQARIETLEQRYSRYRDDSLTTRINDAAGGSPVEVDEETAGLLNYAHQAFTQSEGLFDITSGVLRRAWDFHSGQLPQQTELEPILPLVGWHRVEWNPPCIRLPVPGMEIDFGGYVKEYAVDAAAQACREAGIEHGLVEMGGDLQAIGPHPDGSPWRVGIQHPRQPDQAIAKIDLYSGGLATSGDYERYMEIDGQRYCHILNPQTGWPVAGLAGVSVLAEQTLVAGTMSTIAMLQTAAEAADWLADNELVHLWVDAGLRLGGILAD